MKEKERIPKVIHYFWFGGKQKPKLAEKCIASWKKYCPDYEIKEWNENNFDISICDYAKEAYEAKKWAFVSDYARLWVVYNYGGVYLDTDVELIKSLDEILYNEAFFASEDNRSVSSGLGFGARQHNSLVKYLLDEYESIHFRRDDGSLDLTPCPIRQTRRLEAKYNKFKLDDKVISFDNTVFYPKEYFCPFDPNTRTLHKTNNTIAIHWFAGSWQTKKTRLKYFLINLPKTHAYRLLIKLIGEKRYSNLRRRK